MAQSLSVDTQDGRHFEIDTSCRSEAEIRDELRVWGGGVLDRYEVEDHGAERESVGNDLDQALAKVRRNQQRGWHY